MSVDWNVVCDKCKRYHHLGQDMAGEFISEHIDHQRTFQFIGNLRIVCTDNVPGDYSEARK